MNNIDKENWLSKQDPEFFNDLPSNYDAMMSRISPVDPDFAIGHPVKVLLRPADPWNRLGEAGLMVLEPGDGIVPHKHVNDRECYIFPDKSGADLAIVCMPGETHEITPRKKKTIVEFFKTYPVTTELNDKDFVIED